MQETTKNTANRYLSGLLAMTLVFAPLGKQAQAGLTTISNTPIFVSTSVPPNMMLTLSVEWPTGTVAAYNDNVSTETGLECPGRDGNGYGRCYFDSRTYLGYFDPAKCYTYDSTNNYFVPSSTGTGTYLHQCSSKWSGNFLNWATMHALDEFRYAMTGGDRYIDTSTLTVVEKAFHNGEGGYGQFPIKRIATNAETINGTSVPGVAPTTVTPVSGSGWGDLFVRVHNDGAVLSKSGVTGSEGRVMQIAKNAAFDTGVSTYLVRVKLCDSTVGLESNCRLYGTSLKPTGLIQQNADKMRFGVTAYLNDDSQSRPGGVLRSRMKFVGPNNIVPNGTPTTNANFEISAADGTLPLNPDPADATASGVSNSGVINYLNKFGKPSASYKSYDTLSEMFYEATRYMRNLSATPEYTSGTINDTMKDGFPYITNWNTLDQSISNNRPIQYSCQKTFFVGIADSNAWCDTLVPGNRAAVRCGGRTGTIIDPDGIQVSDLDDEIGNHEGRTSLGTWLHDAGWGRWNTFHLGGLAFWANTRDILPDDTAKPWTIGKQTAQSYWVDVRETGSSEYPWNQIWAAAKYGGFDDRRANTSTVRNLASEPLQASEWDKDGNGVPDNYFTGERPDKLITSLSSVFQDVLDRNYSGAGAAVSTQYLAAGASSYQVQYYSKDWSGDVRGNTLTLDSNGIPTETNVWGAQSKLQTLASGTGWDTSRKIATWNGTKGIPFRLNNSVAVGNLTATQLTYLGADATNQQDLLNYIRGARTKEGTKYRVRTVLLGDIVNSEATYVGGPEELYSDGYNPGFSSFKSSNASRRPVVYVGANDGMLHAFNACTASGTAACPAVGGDELWAYVPSFVLSGPSSPATPTVDGLAARANLGTFSHRYYVDQTPVVRSVDFARTGTAPSGGFSSALASDWRTLLVGGLNKGGKGYYAIDVTTPIAADETALASKVLWEFADEDMGYSYGRPLIFKTRKYGWVVIVTSGYNNTTGSHPGQGYLYVLNAKTGQLLEKIGTGAGDAATPSGFAFAAEFTPDFSDLTLDQVYGGDLLGNLWRFDLTQPAGTATAYPAPTKIAVLKDSTGNTQPITTEPSIEKEPRGSGRWVLVGTGRLFDPSELKNTQTQTFYALRDGTVTSPFTSATLPASLTFPIGRSSMVANTNLLTGITPDDTKPMGWYYDLTHTSGSPDNATERIINTPIPNVGEVAFIGQTPATDPCAPGVNSNNYVVDFATGKTRLTDSSGNPLAYFSVSGQAALKILFVKDASGRVRGLYSGSGDGSGAIPAQLRNLPGYFGFASGAPVRLEWREVLQ